jgi:23S rRNA (pseudouridine1915-N3)-methyltransferase
MQLIVIAVGSRMPAWVDTAFDDYASRMPPDLKLVLREVKPEPRTAGKTVEAMMSAESERLRAALPKRGPRIVLDEHGRDLTSMALSSLIGQWRADGDDVSFLIGGPDGLDDDIKSEARMRIRLSSMTLPHGMARVLLAEQLYRAWSIAQNHPYHRA